MSQPKVSEKVQEAIFNQIQQDPLNNECADCHNKSPTWVSLDFGVFICIRCSGVHRQIGPHITRVRSTRLDGWTKENIEIMATVGNRIANDFYELNMPNGFRKPGPNTSAEECRRFIDQKYIKKQWAIPGYEVPVKAFVEARQKGGKPDFSYSKKQGAQQEEEYQEPQSQPQAQAQPQYNERQHNQRESGSVRKKSVSLDKMPNPQNNQQQTIDLLSADDDLLGVGSNPAPQNIQQSMSTSPPTRKINFANFKKNQSASGSNQEQPQSNQGNQNDNNPFGFNGSNANTGNQNNNSNFNNNTSNNNGSFNNNNNNNTNPFMNNQNNQNQQSNVDVMKLYGQQTNPMGHQNHFMNGGSHQHSWSANAGAWNNNNNRNMYGGGNMGMQPNYSMNQPQNFNNSMGFNNNSNMNMNMNMGGNFGGNNMGNMQGQPNGNMGANDLKSLYQNTNNNGWQGQSANRFF